MAGGWKLEHETGSEKLEKTREMKIGRDRVGVNVKVDRERKSLNLSPRVFSLE